MGEHEGWGGVTDVRRVEFHMGTAITIDVRRVPVSVNAGLLLDDAFARLAGIDSTFSTYSPDSEISRFGRGEIELDQCSDDVRFILDLSNKLRVQTDGYFDIHAAARTEPARSTQACGDERRLGTNPVEPSGVVKGWAIEQVAELLRSRDVYDFCINAGGDVFASGSPEPGEKWRIGLQHPFEKMSVMAVVAVRDMAVATSAVYERGAHIVSPVRAPEDTYSYELASLTIVGPDMTLTDAYATAAFAMGRAGVEWAAGQPGFAVFAVDHLGMTHHNDRMDEYLVAE